MVLVKLVILGLLAAIVVSLGSALYHLASGKGDSDKLLRALTVRITLSLLLFALLMIAWRVGLIAPRGFTP
ncbi:MAG TPA: twin transmembrane helix small protein [Steroidobacteraceae bacterium]